jgi:hypothetical protein
METNTSPEWPLYDILMSKTAFDQWIERQHDRIGRKATLVTALLIMGISTVCCTISHNGLAQQIATIRQRIRAESTEALKGWQGRSPWRMAE